LRKISHRDQVAIGNFVVMAVQRSPGAGQQSCRNSRRTRKGRAHDQACSGRCSSSQRLAARQQHDDFLQLSAAERNPPQSFVRDSLKMPLPSMAIALMAVFQHMQFRSGNSPGFKLKSGGT
jgi:hypothetical protein